MDKWEGRVALVTGASSGIGAAITLALARAGMKVVGIARNDEPIRKLNEEISEGCQGFITPLKCDLANTDEIDDVFKTIKEKFGGVDVCVNNAGFSCDSTLLEGTPSQWRGMMAVNVIGLCYCCKLSTASMVERGVTDGHIINIGSTLAHSTKCFSKVSFYGATKHAVKFLTEGLRQEMIEKKLFIKVSSISPGVVSTDFGNRAFGEGSELMKVVSSMPHLTCKDVVDATLYVLSAPPHTEINDIVLRPVGQDI